MTAKPQTLKDYIEEFTEFQISCDKKSEEMLKAIFSKFWEENPSVKVITWKQYAPSTNDGDLTNFHVDDLTFSNATDTDDFSDLSSGEYQGEKEGVWATDDYGIEEFSKGREGIKADCIKSLCTFIESYYMENRLRDLFGDDVIVCATRAGFEIRENYFGY